MCTFRAYIKPFIFENIFLRIEKILTVFSILEKIFSILEKIFSKINGLMCALAKSIQFYVNILSPISALW